MKDSFYQALLLIISNDQEFWQIVWRSVYISGTATLCAALIALPLASWLAVSRFWGREFLRTFITTLIGFPAIVVGLLVLMLLSRQGPLGALGLLFSVKAIMIAQTVLIIPLIAAFALTSLERRWRELHDYLTVLRVPKPRVVLLLLREEWRALTMVLIGGFSRAIAELGTAMMVGGNIAGQTRVMTTAIALEASKGNFDLALALGIFLVLLSFVLALLALALQRGLGGGDRQLPLR